MKTIPTLRQIEVSLKTLQKAIDFHKAWTKEGMENPRLENLEKMKTKVLGELSSRVDPKNAKRCSLPKKQQRKLGLLPNL
jgi:hypothetical protein